MNGVRVLYVAPPPGAAARTAERLRDLGDDATAVTAETGSEAMERIESGDFDCVVSRVELPETDGLALLDRVRAEAPALPFVLVGEDDPEDVAGAALSTSLTGYVDASGDGNSIALAGWIRRLVEQRRATAEATERRRLESVVREVHRAVIQATSREDLEREICSVVTDSEPYRFAWIADVDDGGERVVARATAGVEENYLDDVDITVGPGETAQGPTGRAFRTGETQVMQNIPEDPRYEPWRAAALERGYRSSAAIPLTYREEFYGVLNVYADRVGAFDDTEIALLDDVAADVSFAVHALETRAALEVSEKRYSSIVEAVNDGIIIAQDGVVRFVNSTLAEMGGYERADLLDESILEFVAPEYRDELIDRHRKRQRGDATEKTYEIEILSKSGERTPVEISAAPVEYEGRAATVTIVRDVSERHAYQKQLEQTNRRLREQRAYTDRILDSIDDVFFIVDTDGRLRWWNQSARDLWDYAEEEARSTPIEEFFRDDEAEQIHESFREVLDRGVTRTEVTVVTSDGDEIPYEFVANALEDSDGDRIVAGTGRDITERTERERQLQVIDRVLRHNLHNDMAVVQGHADEIRRVGSERAADHATQIIRRSDGLLETAKKERAVVEILLEKPTPAHLDLGRAVRVAVEAARESYPDARIRTSVPDDVSVFAIPELETALAELLENAIRYSDRASPAVDVTVEQSEGAVELRVADDGPGIPEQERKVLTRERDIEPLYHGSGLGLWLVHWIVDRSGGSLRFTENEPRGSVVSMTLTESGGQADG